MGPDVPKTKNPAIVEAMWRTSSGGSERNKAFKLSLVAVRMSSSIGTAFECLLPEN